MTPRAVRPARARTCAPWLSDARLARLVACLKGVDCMAPNYHVSRRGNPGPRSGFRPLSRFGPAAPPLAYQVPQRRLGSGSDGGVAKAGARVRSSASSGERAAASRAVSGGRFHFSSTSLSTEVWSKTSELTSSGRAYGDTITAGTRNPYLPYRPAP